jgi:hypothetical protein
MSKVARANPDGVSNACFFFFSFFLVVMQLAVSQPWKESNMKFCFIKRLFYTVLEQSMSVASQKK